MPTFTSTSPINLNVVDAVAGFVHPQLIKRATKSLTTGHPVADADGAVIRAALRLANLAADADEVGLNLSELVTALPVKGWVRGTVLSGARGLVKHESAKAVNAAVQNVMSTWYATTAPARSTRGGQNRRAGKTGATRQLAAASK